MHASGQDAVLDLKSGWKQGTGLRERTGYAAEIGVHLWVQTSYTDFKTSGQQLAAVPQLLGQNSPWVVPFLVLELSQHSQHTVPVLQ